LGEDIVADDRSIKCGFIGLGSQGAPMARRMIDAGYPVTLWARREATLAPYRDTAATYAASVAELGAQVEHVGVCVVDDNDVRQVCDELIPAMRPGGLIAIHSTIHPDTCKALEARAKARGLRLLDAPVSGGQPAAEVGALTVMVGGDADAFTAAKPVFESFGRMIVHLGGVGAGQNAKLINNALLTAHLGLAHAAFSAGDKLGVDRKVLAELLLNSSGRSMGVEVYARMPTPGAFLHGANLLAKDVRLLGEVLGAADPAFTPIHDTAVPFVKLVQDDAASN
jgi:3-hydroxyisobutyrate dehydrogenase-like beta-hydroxyacid dehydrogenase